MVCLKIQDAEKSGNLAQRGRNEGQCKKSTLKGVMPLLDLEEWVGIKKEGNLPFLVSKMSRCYTWFCMKSFQQPQGNIIIFSYLQIRKLRLKESTQNLLPCKQQAWHAKLLLVTTVVSHLWCQPPFLVPRSAIRISAKLLENLSSHTDLANHLLWCVSASVLRVTVDWPQKIEYPLGEKPFCRLRNPRFHNE